MFDFCRDNLTLEDDDKMCELIYLFYNSDTNDFGLSISVGNMSELGRMRFIQELNSFPDVIRDRVLIDINKCVYAALDAGLPADCIFPEYLRSML